MSRTVTAIFETADTAELVRSEIAKLGVAERHISVVGGEDRAGEIDGLNLPQDEASTYKAAVKRGHHVVSADVEDEHVDATAEIMRHPEGGVDIDAHETDYRASPDYQTDMAGSGEETIAVAEERMAVGKREVDRGTTHVRTYVQEVPIEERIRLRDEHVNVERRATEGRTVSGAEADKLFQDRDIAVEEHDEEAVVSKEAVVTEEIVVSKDVEEREEVVRDTVRKTEVDVDRR